MTTARRHGDRCKPGQTSGRSIIYRPPAELSPSAARLHNIVAASAARRCAAMHWRAANATTTTSRGRRTLAKPPPTRVVNDRRSKITIQHFHRPGNSRCLCQPTNLPVTADHEHLFANSAHSAESRQVCSGKIDPPKTSSGPDVGGKIAKSIFGRQNHVFPNARLIAEGSANLHCPPRRRNCRSIIQL